MLNKIKVWIKNNEIKLILFCLAILSIVAFCYYFSIGIHILYGDALSRLNISRKIIDNLTPGFAQLGNVWLPLPQVLMLPFIWNSFLWHSGIAGSIMSMLAFIFGGYCIYRSGKLLTGSSIASTMALSLYALNINVLYMQTTSMSEVLFICFSAAVMYYIISWTRSSKLTDLIKSAFFINGVTLTRYEGLAILFGSIGIVAIFSYFKYKNLKKAESDLFIFASLASLGFAFWTFYLTTIFGDPLYWMHYYASPQIPTDPNITQVTYAQNLSFLDAIWKYTTSVIWMNGIIPTFFAVGGIFILVYKNIRKFDIKSLPLLIPFSVFAFMVLTLMRNTPIKQPDLNLINVLSPTTSYFNEFNIRYGLMVTAFISLFSVYLFNIRFIILRVFLIAFFCVQVYSYFDLSYTIIFQLPRDLHHSLMQNQPPQNDDVSWLQKNYDGGLIMVSALKHDPQMFKTGFDYKTYIHEGTGLYWKASIQDPTVYAKWVWMDYNNMEDQVTKNLKDSGVLQDAYDLVYDERGVRIYKIKGVTRKSVGE